MDYFYQLGINAIWISPFFKSPMVDNGYDISDYKQVDPLFGTLEDFRVKTIFQFDEGKVNTNIIFLGLGKNISEEKH